MSATYEVTFSRLGRNHEPEPLRCTVRDLDELEIAIIKHARKYCVSRTLNCIAEWDPDTGRGMCTVFAGIQVAGGGLIRGLETV